MLRDGEAGAEVTAFDRYFKHGDDTMGQIPYADFDQRFGMTFEQRIAERRYMVTRMQNSFWLSYRALQSKARLYNGNVYRYPAALGQFDYAFFGSVLLHLQNPLQALISFAPAIREKIIITEPYENIGGASDCPVMFLRVNATDKNQDTWWYLTPEFLRNLLGVLGFPKFTLSVHYAKFVQSQTDVKLYTVVAER